jgi:exodeoxyribonuclease I
MAGQPAAVIQPRAAPQFCLRNGLPQHEFTAAIERKLAMPSTAGVSYNTIH